VVKAGGPINSALHFFGEKLARLARVQKPGVH
jgi:hypothetical protein